MVGRGAGSNSGCADCPVYVRTAARDYGNNTLDCGGSVCSVSRHANTDAMAFGDTVSDECSCAKSQHYRGANINPDHGTDRGGADGDIHDRV